MSSGECPDMYSSWSGGPMYEYIDSGFAQPIDDLLDQSDIKDKLLDAAIEQGSYNGHVYAIPYLNVSLQVSSTTKICLNSTDLKNRRH